jgi:HEAT repeat protein
LAEKAAEALVPDDRAFAEDKEAQVRRQAVEALAEWPAREALPRLIELAKTSSDPVVRRAALEALGEMSGEPAAVAALTALCKGARK